MCICGCCKGNGGCRKGNGGCCKGNGGCFKGICCCITCGLCCNEKKPGRENQDSPIVTQPINQPLPKPGLPITLNIKCPSANTVNF